MFDVRLLSFLIRGLNVNVRTPVCTHLRQNLPRCDLSVHTEHTRKRPPSANSPQATGGPGKNRSRGGRRWWLKRSEEHTSELQSLMRISYAVFCLKKKNIKTYTKLRTRTTTIIHTTTKHTC